MEAVGIFGLVIGALFIIALVAGIIIIIRRRAMY
jgi:hypothetical protein